jgi:hypothetical protein
MARTNEQEREALKNAAYATAPLLTRLRQQRADLDQRIQRLEAVIAAYEDSLGKRRRRASPDQPIMPKVPRGQVRQHIDALLERGGDYSDAELRQALFSEFGIRYARSSIYVVLRRGEKSGRYELKDGKRWRAKV